MNELINAQNTLNQMQLNQAKQQKKVWWQKNKWIVIGGVATTLVVTYLVVKNYKKK